VSAAPLIRLSDVHKRYETAGAPTEVLRGIDLDIAHGDFTALQGPSGSGKSTLLHILGLLDRPTSGRYELDGRDVSTLDDDTLSGLRNRTFGFVFQSFHLIPYVTALENVLLPGLYGPQSRRELTARARDILERVGLADRAQFRPGQLSGGQQQRVALARALLNEPSCIFADEPTGQLDSTTSREIMELLARINAQGTTVVMVTHDPQTAAFASSAIHLLDGRIKDDA
jgi:putative ABC transport system ATP-binding protein